VVDELGENKIKKVKDTLGDVMKAEEIDKIVFYA
jgi:hypothetical protein